VRKRSTLVRQIEVRLAADCGEIRAAERNGAEDKVSARKRCCGDQNGLKSHITTERIVGKEKVPGSNPGVGPNRLFRIPHRLPKTRL
jgi:hypothetical protein